MKTLIVLAASAAVLCACATQPTPAPAAAPVAAAPVSGPNASATKVSADPNKVICRHDQAPMASHIPVKNCHTKAEWVEIDKASAANVAQFSRSLATASGQGVGQ
jgi:hypothetical protein